MPNLLAVTRDLGRRNASITIKPTTRGTWSVHASLATVRTRNYWGAGGAYWGGQKYKSWTKLHLSELPKAFMEAERWLELMVETYPARR